MSIKTGVCSVTFRKNSVEEILDLLVRAGLDGVEWGSDVHVPPNLSLDRVREIRRMTEDRGIELASYGGYYNVLGKNLKHPEFEPYLDIAEALGTRIMRIWSGGGDSKDANDDLFKIAAEKSWNLAEKASARGITLAYEFHMRGLTDTVETTLRLLRSVNHSHMQTYYQPYAREDLSPVQEVEMLYAFLVHIHCYHQIANTQVSLEAGESEWMEVIRFLESKSFDRYMLIEFVKGGTVDNFMKDAAVLKRWINEGEG